MTDINYIPPHLKETGKQIAEARSRSRDAAGSELERQVVKAMCESGIHQYHPQVVKAGDYTGMPKPSDHLLRFAKKLLSQNKLKV